MSQFNPLAQSFDVAALEADGWSIAGNMAYRHILHDYLRDSEISQERITQIIMQYQAEGQTGKIIQALKGLIALKNETHRISKGEQ